eukprot:6467429-Amphidinium_carterae.2
MDIDDDLWWSPKKRSPRMFCSTMSTRHIKREAHPDLANQVSEDVQAARQRVRIAASKPRRLRFLQLGIELHGLETALEVKLESVRVEFKNRCLELVTLLVAQQAEIQAQERRGYRPVTGAQGCAGQPHPQTAQYQRQPSRCCKDCRCPLFPHATRTQAFQEFPAVAQAELSDSEVKVMPSPAAESHAGAKTLQARDRSLLETPLLAPVAALSTEQRDTAQPTLLPGQTTLTMAWQTRGRTRHRIDTTQIDERPLTQGSRTGTRTVDTLAG